MTSPPGSAPATQAFPGANREDRASGFLSRKTVTREAMKVLADLGLDVRPAGVRVLVKRFIEAGHTSTADLRSWVIAYADPTGETAVRNVMKETR
jgi:hypothetical protein